MGLATRFGREREDEAAACRRSVRHMKKCSPPGSIAELYAPACVGAHVMRWRACVRAVTVWCDDRCYGRPLSSARCHVRSDETRECTRHAATCAATALVCASLSCVTLCASLLRSSRSPLCRALLDRGTDRIFLHPHFHTAKAPPASHIIGLFGGAPLFLSSAICKIHGVTRGSSGPHELQNAPPLGGILRPRLAATASAAQPRSRAPRPWAPPQLPFAIHPPRRRCQSLF